MVGGVSPGKGGQVHLGLPVFNSVQEVRADWWNYATYFLVLQVMLTFMSLLWLSSIYI